MFKFKRLIIPSVILILLIIIVLYLNVPKEKPQLSINESEERSPLLTSPVCTPIKENKDSNVNVVFLPYKYENSKDFFEEIDSILSEEDGFLSVEPFKKNKDKINFYAIFTDEINCDIEDQTLLCFDKDIKIMASKCPYDYIFILGNRNAFLDLLEPIRSSAYIDMSSINTADNKLVVLHEFGHLFGGLADEYVEKSIVIDVNDFPNCDRRGCSEWESFKNGGAGCFKGCSMDHLYRSVETGIMRNYLRSNTFGVYNEWLLEQQF